MRIRDGLGDIDPKSLGSFVAPVESRQCAGTSFHTRRLELPNGKGWIEIRGEFNPFDLDEPQRRLIAMMADYFAEFERDSVFRDRNSQADADKRTMPPNPQTSPIQSQETGPKTAGS
jgi:hypothetical protein